jgi:hypothetical protein
MIRYPVLASTVLAVLLSLGSTARAQSVQYMVNYQTAPGAGWLTYGTFVSIDNANQLAGSLSQQGYAVQIVPVNPPVPITTAPALPPGVTDPKYWPRTHWNHDRRGRDDRDRDRERRDRDRP